LHKKNFTLSERIFEEGYHKGSLPSKLLIGILGLALDQSSSLAVPLLDYVNEVKTVVVELARERKGCYGCVSSTATDSVVM
jgi:hypothetical protein